MTKKALFMDYYGTLAHETGPIAAQVVKRVSDTSNGASPEKVLSYWWASFREKLVNANGNDFRTQHDVALDNFKDLLEHFGSSEDPEEMLCLMEEHWCTTALHEDAKEFIETTNLPIYIVTNSDDRYVSESLALHGLEVNGVITSEQARFSKPRPEIFLYALDKTGLKPKEVVHIGDSLSSDVECPKAAGIDAIWLNRDGKSVPDGVMSVGSLQELGAYLTELD